MKQKITLKTIITGAAICFTANLFAQTVQWSANYTANSGDIGLAVTVGGDGRAYVAGATGSYTDNALLISYTSAGVQNWVKTYAPANFGVYADRYNAVSTIGSGSSVHIYAVGRHEPNTTNSYDVILSGYNQSGSYLSGFPVTWNRTGGGSDEGTLIAIDGSENIYVCGTNSQNGGDMVILKYNSAGTKQWEATYNSSGTQSDVPTFMKLSGSYLYISGITTVSGANTTGFVKKIDISNGSTSWTYTFDNSSTDADNLYALDVLTLHSGKYIYAVGSTKNTTLDAVLLKINDSGTLLSHDYYDGPNALSDEFYSIAAQAPADAPEIYVTGGCQESSYCPSGWNYVTIRYNDCPTHAWVKAFSGHNPTCGCPVVTTKAKQVLISPFTGKIFVTGDTYCYVAGMDESTVRYDASTGTEEWSHTFNRTSGSYAVNCTADKFPMATAPGYCGLDFVYITGFTQESSGGAYDATTIQYSQYSSGSQCRFRFDTQNNVPEIRSEGIFPNPFSASAVFRFSGETSNTNSSFIIYDITGSEVKRIENSSTNEIKLTRDNMKEGIYFYRYVQDDQVLTTGKFIIAD